MLDGNHDYLRMPSKVTTVIKGDAKCLAVAAASCVAKVTRDRMMIDEAEHYPPYDFESNVGYPAPAHKLALAGYGPSAIHRRSWIFMESLCWRGGGADTDHRGDAHPGDDHTQGERQLDLKQQLAVGHAHAAAGVADCRIDVADAGKSIANNRQERVQHQCHDRRPRADAADDLDVKQINIERNQKSEQREARHGLHDVGKTEHWLTEARLASQKDAEGHADQNRDAGRNCDEK